MQWLNKLVALHLLPSELLFSSSSSDSHLVSELQISVQSFLLLDSSSDQEPETIFKNLIDCKRIINDSNSTSTVLQSASVFLCVCVCLCVCACVCVCVFQVGHGTMREGEREEGYFLVRPTSTHL